MVCDRLMAFLIVALCAPHGPAAIRNWLDASRKCASNCAQRHHDGLPMNLMGVYCLNALCEGHIALSPLTAPFQTMLVRSSRRIAVLTTGDE
jgi:hypothetical protein